LFDLFLHRGFMRLRRKLHGLGQWNLGSPGVKRLGNVLHERLRRSGDKGKMHIFPVFADGVVDNRPTLQQRLGVRPCSGFVGQNDAVGALPDGHLADVADKDIALAATGGGDGHLAEILGS